VATTLFEARRMASKFTVACVCAIVITLSVIILVMESLSSPSQCRQNDEIKTEKGMVGKPEPAPISTSTTVLSPKATFASYSTTHPLSGITFSTKIPRLPSRATPENDSALHPTFQTNSTLQPIFSTNSTILPSSGVASPENSTPRHSSRGNFEMNSTIYPSSELTFSTNSITRFSSIGTMTSNSVTRISSEPSSPSTSGIHYSSGFTSRTASTTRPFPEGISKTTIHSFLGTTSVLNITSEVTPVGQSNYSSSTDFQTKREEQNHEAVFSTPNPSTVFSAPKDGENIISRVTLPSLSEEKTEDLFVSDLQTQTGETETVTPPENSSSLHSQTPLPRNGSRNIIITPVRNCGNGEKKDNFGTCRPIW
jgi:hypothetical protein